MVNERRGGMRRFVRIALLFVGLGGCAQILGLDTPHRVDEDAPGGAGVSASGAAGADGGAGAGADGSAGADGGADAGGSAGSPSGGRPGDGGGAGRLAPGGGRGGTGADSGGVPGGAAGADERGGEGGVVDSGPTLGAPCDESGEYGCTVFEPNLLLICIDGHWEIGESCIAGSRCDPESRECRPLDFICHGREEAFCSGRHELIDCSTDPFEPEYFECPLRCDEGRCLPGSGDELIVHTERISQTGSVVLWDEPIHVCFHDGGDDAALVAVIRDEVEQSWGFLLDVEFTGWSECTGDEANRRVELAFLDDCELRLGGAVLSGAPPEGEARTVEFCRTFYTATGKLDRLLENDPLLRFLARHQFGHVLGSADNDATIEPTVMRRWVRASDAAIGITSDDIQQYRLNYGQKPSRRLITSSGACLSPDALGFRARACSYRYSGAFGFVGGEVESLRPEIQGCFSVPPGEGSLVNLGTCGDPTGATGVRFVHARWSTPDRCVAPERAELGSPLTVGPCAPAGDPTQAWWFEIVDSDEWKLVARLRFEATGDCVGLLEPAQFGAIPKLVACNEPPELEQVFALWPEGRISHGPSGLCPQWNPPGGVVYLDNNCDHDTYWLSGSLETPDGRLLSFTRDDGLEQLRAVSPAPGGLPLPSQIFGLPF